MVIEPQFEQGTGGPEPRRPQTPCVRPRRKAARCLGPINAPSLVSCDRHVIENLEVLADILACIFAEASDGRYTGFPTGDLVATARAITTRQREEMR